jgi:hypothetical protein
VPSRSASQSRTRKRHQFGFSNSSPSKEGFFVEAITKTRLYLDLTCAAIRLGQELALLVESDRVYGEGAAFRDLADLHRRALSLVIGRHDRIIQSGVQSRVKRATITLSNLANDRRRAEAVAVLSEPSVHALNDAPHESKRVEGRFRLLQNEVLCDDGLRLLLRQFRFRLQPII